jgi:Protein of unknown function (DUF2970)
METSKDDTQNQAPSSGEQSAQPDLSGEMSGNKTDVKANVQDMTLWQTTQSVLFAMLGVQTSKNAKRDFSKGKVSHFIVIGVVFGVLFVLSVVLAVNLILSAIDA